MFFRQLYNLERPVQDCCNPFRTLHDILHGAKCDYLQTTTVKAVQSFSFKTVGRTEKENDEEASGIFLTKNRKYYRRLFIFEPVEVAQNTGGLLNNSSLSSKRVPLYLPLSHSVIQKCRFGVFRVMRKGGFCPLNSLSTFQLERSIYTSLIAERARVVASVWTLSKGR